jgi:putative mRNA 3-end processing factor
MSLISFTDKGLYCAQGNFYIDPWQPVEKAVITHAHSDHARGGSQSYLCHRDTLPLLQLRLGPYNYQIVDWNEKVYMNEVMVSLHPAGHIIGSSQIRVEYKGEVWVVSGDYKTEPDGLSGVFEPIPCHTFISESTFGLPIYNWKPQQEIYHDIQNWVRSNEVAGKTSVLIGYSLGKAQRLLKAVEEVTGNIYVHGAIWNVHETLRQAGFNLPAVQRITPDTPRDAFKSSVIIAPPSADGSPWMRRFPSASTGICSGWMQVRGNQRRRNADAGFALSDHADWQGLLQTVKATGAQKVYITHGFQSVFSRYLNEIGIDAAEVKTEFGTEEEPPPTSVKGEEDTLSY